MPAIWRANQPDSEAFVTDYIRCYPDQIVAVGSPTGRLVKR
jgi:hypothetical protein